MKKNKKMTYHSNHTNHITFAQISVKGNTMNVSVRFEKMKNNDEYVSIIRKDIWLWQERNSLH